MSALACTDAPIPGTATRETVALSRSMRVVRILLAISSRRSRTARAPRGGRHAPRTRPAGIAGMYVYVRLTGAPAPVHARLHARARSMSNHLANLYYMYRCVSGYLYMYAMNRQDSYAIAVGNW